jgi:hypothetical protein
MTDVQVRARGIETLLDAQRLTQLDRAGEFAREFFLRNDLHRAAANFIHLVFDRCEFLLLSHALLSF